MVLKGRSDKCMANSGLVDLSLPPASDPSVRDPPLSALQGGQPQRERKVRLREPAEHERPSSTRRRERERERTPAPTAPPTRQRSFVRESGGGSAGRAGDRRSMGGAGGVAYAPMPIPGAGAGLGYGYVPAGY